MLQPKDLVNGYELLERLDSDAAGEVWSARKPDAEPGQTVRLRFVKLWTSATEMRQALCAIEIPATPPATPNAASLLHNKVAELEAEVARLRSLATPPAESAPPNAAPAFAPLAPPVQVTDTSQLSIPGFIATPKRSPQKVEPLSIYGSDLDTSAKSGFKISGNVVKALVVLLFISSIGSIIAQTMRLSTRARRNSETPTAATVAPAPVAPSVPMTNNDALPPADGEITSTANEPRPNKPASSASPVIKSQKLPGGAINLVRIDQRQTQHGSGNAVTELYLGETEVTRRTWRAVTQLPKVRRDLSPAPWQSQKDDKAKDKVKSKDKDQNEDSDKDKNHAQPVAQDDCEDCAASKISWKDAQEFLARVNALSNNALVFRLPTEAEWETGCADCNLVAQSNIKGRGVNKTQSVRQSGVNKLGLLGMYGNVWEWCQDVAPNDDERRIIRGGSWKRLDAWDATEEDYESYPDGGFRLAATPKP